MTWRTPDFGTTLKYFLHQVCPPPRCPRHPL